MSILAEIQRRGFVWGLFGGIAAAALANVARAQTPDPIPCQLGPLPHQKGPLVWMDMDQIELTLFHDGLMNSLALLACAIPPICHGAFIQPVSMDNSLERTSIR